MLVLAIVEDDRDVLSFEGCRSLGNEAIEPVEQLARCRHSPLEGHVGVRRSHWQLVGIRVDAPLLVLEDLGLRLQPGELGEVGLLDATDLNAKAESSKGVEACAGITHRLAFLSWLVHSPVDVRHLRDPASPLRMVQVHEHLGVPMEVVGEIGYLFVEAFDRVACYPPNSARSTSTVAEHSGHCVVTTDVPCSFSWR